ncbi:DUF1566 domain-containing protein [Cellvibrio sp. KY-GH-1]|uniref:DUF1566 domain-containing protein n=1 Tax=Cellvibrio sp. KY-GH-1 TaxID=2303332 RepID=UPI001245EB70|nr:DUF1566 domain-containing protein [Cellvibrio sp. KY-GH-1]QEY15492.1 DUF1566 domain-containing protein [Cellvibrio sp. KY-GH-1]
MQNNQEKVSAEKNNLTPPRIGTYWPGQGGIYIGQMLDGETQIALIMATKPFEGEWGNYGETIPGEFSFSNGQHNSQLILAAEPENQLLLDITKHEADGHTDFYLPANFEQNLICANAQAHVEKVWHWSSTQYSAITAWFQDFEYGGQLIDSKGCRYAARAVRRLIIE